MKNKNCKHILLLNPPGDMPYLRGGYCSGVSKGRYYYPAIDLVVQSGILADRFRVSVLDAIAENKSLPELIEFMKNNSVDVILAVTAHCSWKKDLELLETVASRFPGLRIFLTGGYLLFQGKEILSKYEFLEGILLDFTSPAFKSYLCNNTDHFVNTLLTKDLNGSRAELPTLVDYPCPRHDLFPIDTYNLPFSRYRPFTVIHQSFGCPFHCSFCVFSKIDFQIRSTTNILQELSILQKLGIRELFFADPTFAARPADSLELCDAMITQNMKFSWFCQTRTDVLNNTLIEKMKEAGCHTIQFGVETTHTQLQKDYKKRLNLDKATEIFRECKKRDIRILGSIIIGLPGDAKQNILDTLQFLIRERFDYVSVNIAAPEIGTTFREDSLQQGLFTLKEEQIDPTHLTPLLDSPQLSKTEQWELRNLFLKKFYLRPGYIWTRAVSTRSINELANLVKEGLFLARSAFSRE